MANLFLDHVSIAHPSLLLAKRRAYCAVCSGCLIKMTLAGWLKQQKFLSHSYEVWEVQNQGASEFSC